MRTDCKSIEPNYIPRLKISPYFNTSWTKHDSWFDPLPLSLQLLYQGVPRVRPSLPVHLCKYVLPHTHLIMICMNVVFPPTERKTYSSVSTTLFVSSLDSRPRTSYSSWNEFFTYTHNHTPTLFLPHRKLHVPLSIFSLVDILYIVRKVLLYLYLWRPRFYHSIFVQPMWGGWCLLVFIYISWF